MKSFFCEDCGAQTLFENVFCVNCGRTLGYLPDLHILSALDQRDDEFWRPLTPLAQGRRYRMCVHYSRDNVCNWMVAADEPGPFCRSCRLNQVIPDLSVAENRDLWQRLETAKRRMIYGLLRLRLSVRNKDEDLEHGLAFAFLADPDPSFQENGQVMTGHSEGVITINIAEADDATRERKRLEMGEPYRTLLGHFRHEVGHYYWERLILDGQRLDPYRELFGDEREDYGLALQRHYQGGPPANWQQRFVTAYASAHPWEDWAESWAHYLHMIDTMETARAFGLSIQAPLRVQPVAGVPSGSLEYRIASFDQMLKDWFPLTFAINSINRSMGQPDLYPFVLSDPAVDKLRFVHDVVGASAKG